MVCFSVVWLVSSFTNNLSSMPKLDDGVMAFCQVPQLVMVIYALEVVENRCGATSVEHGYEADRL